MRLEEGEIGREVAYEEVEERVKVEETTKVAYEEADVACSRTSALV